MLEDASSWLPKSGTGLSGIFQEDCVDCLIAELQIGNATSDVFFNQYTRMNTLRFRGKNRSSDLNYLVMRMLCHDASHYNPMMPAGSVVRAKNGGSKIKCPKRKLHVFNQL